MEVITVNHQIQDNSKIYALFDNTRTFVLAGDVKSITGYLGISYAAFATLRRGEALRLHTVEFLDRYAKVYKLDERIGTRTEIAEQLNVSFETIRKRLQSEGRYIGGRLNGKMTHETELTEFLNRKEREVEEAKKLHVPEIYYKGENKDYMDSLFKSTVGGWRA